MKTFACLWHSTRCCAAEVFFHWPRVEWIFRSNKASIRFASAVFFFIQNPEASFVFCLKKKPAQELRWLCSFSGSPSGAGENRTRVQTRKPEAFYMLILWLGFRPISEHKHPNHGLASQLELAREARANCIPEFSTPRDQAPQDLGSCEMFSSYT